MTLSVNCSPVKWWMLLTSQGSYSVGAPYYYYWEADRRHSFQSSIESSSQWCGSSSWHLPAVDGWWSSRRSRERKPRGGAPACSTWFHHWNTWTTVCNWNHNSTSVTSPPNHVALNVCPYVCPSIQFFHLNEIWYEIEFDEWYRTVCCMNRSTVWVKIKSPPTVFWNFFPNGWEFLINFLHTYYVIISTLDYKFLFNYLQLWQRYAILSATT